MDLTALREEGIRIVLSGEEGSRLQERISLLEEPLKRCFRARAREKTGEEWPLRVERRRMMMIGRGRRRERRWRNRSGGGFGKCYLNLDHLVGVTAEDMGEVPLQLLLQMKRRGRDHNG